MAKRPSVKEILEAARKGGAAKPGDEAGGTAEPEAVEPAAEAAPEPAAADEPAIAAPAPEVPSPATLGRPLTLKEKLAAARAGGAPQPAAAKPAAPRPAAAAPAAPVEPEEAATPAEAPKAVPPPAKPLGRPMTLSEKLAAARGAATGAAPAAAPAAKPAAAKPAAPATKAGAAATRALPPLDKITDPKDLAEAARQAAARRAKEEAAAKAAAAPAAAKAKPAPAKPQTVPPKPGRELAATGAEPRGISRRGLFIGSLFFSWIAVAWTTFTAGMVALTTMSVRFMFPNVLAEPPSTIKIGLPSNYDPEDVSDRFKAEWGFWVVRSTKYNGQDIIYAIQSVCTHLGCPPNWLASEQKFKCPCHGSGFYISGINFEGPAPRPLERFKVALADDGQIVVDKSQKFQQELDQWSDPDSFIPA
jgi:cytochrome b6-f complex iron-sulfur subunit